jgi:hypothetical protein
MLPAAGAATIHAAHNSAVTNGIPSRQLRSQSLERGMTLDPAATVAGDEQSTVEGGGAAMDRAPRARLTFEQSRARASLALAAEKDDRTARASDTDSDGIESSGWPLRDLDRNPAQVAADRETLITSALSESSGDHSDLRSALVSEIRQSLSQAAPAEGTAVTPGTDIASRVARLLALQDAARSAPVSGVTLDVGPEDGLATARIRLGLRGPALDALIDIADPAMANRLSGRVEELRRALERTGLEPATVVIREAAAAAVTGRGSNSGAENNTQHEAGRNGWQQRRDPGAADNQKNRRNQKENAR